MRHPIETLWREVGLPEYFLGNDGSNTKLYALYDAILARSSERTEAARIIEMIDFLRSEEGDCVTILCDNPDFNGQPNCAVECNGEWTRWLHRRYTGDTISDALSAAWLECTQIRAAIEAGQKWWSSTNECPSCKQQYTDGETCKAGRGGCPMGGDF